MTDVFGAIDHEQGSGVLAAIASVADPAEVSALTPIVGGASGAATLRVEVGTDAYVLRLDVRRGGLGDPRRSYPCLRAASAAGIAPTVHHADDVTGVALMDFVEQRPLASFPGGRPALLRELGRMVARLQRTAHFPTMDVDFGVLTDALLRFVVDGRLFAPGVLDRHCAALARIRDEYPWEHDQVAAHNDLNPRNVLFDGRRLWLVDWELAFGNDPFADVANLVNNFHDVPDVETLVLEGWLDRSPDDHERHRLALMRDLHRLFSGCLLLSEFVGRRGPAPDLAAPTRAEFGAALARGELRGTRELLYVLGTMHLADVVADRGS